MSLWRGLLVFIHCLIFRGLFLSVFIKIPSKDFTFSTVSLIVALPFLSGGIVPRYLVILVVAP